MKRRFVTILASLPNKERKANERAFRKHYRALAKRFSRRYLRALAATDPAGVQGPSRLKAR